MYFKYGMSCHVKKLEILQATGHAREDVWQGCSSQYLTLLLSSEQVGFQLIRALWASWFSHAALQTNLGRTLDCTNCARRLDIDLEGKPVHCFARSLPFFGFEKFLLKHSVGLSVPSTENKAARLCYC
jgi:hypothetical protein